MDDGAEVSESGQPIFRHKPRTKGFELATCDIEAIDRISRHIEAHVGPVETVFHELISDLVHIDVHWVKPTPARDFHTLITTGMSDRPMNIPEGLDLSPFAELMICLPSSWPISDEAFRDERHYWPIRLIKTLSRLPHEYDTWLGWGHTLPNGDPARPYAPGTKFCCALVLAPTTTPPEFEVLEASPGKAIRFLAAYPLYKEEMALKLKTGAEGLLPRFDRTDVTEVVDIRRRNVARRSFWPF